MTTVSIADEIGNLWDEVQDFIPFEWLFTLWRLARLASTAKQRWQARKPPEIPPASPGNALDSIELQVHNKGGGGNHPMSYKVEYTEEFSEWWDTLSGEQQEELYARVQVLRRDGPHLGRPLVDVLHHSRYPNLKELRGPGNLRTLFMFDPRGVAILLLGGDKTGQWERWYDREIPRAEAIYAQYLAELKEEGLL